MNMYVIYLNSGEASEEDGGEANIWTTDPSDVPRLFVGLDKSDC